MSDSGSATSPAPSTEFVRAAIDKQLRVLRQACAVQRLILHNAITGRWARAGRSDEENQRDSGPNDKYWDDMQHRARRDAQAAVTAAEAALADHVSAHRRWMPPEWDNGDQGRLCWAPFLGGRPIDQHYCQRCVGHTGPHANESGRWPAGVTNSFEWRELLRRLPAGSTGLDPRNEEN